jgi:dTDP-4-dehydrorhamnose 3,5-epimerase
MPFTATPLAGVMLFEPRIWSDDRGYFYESYNERTFREAGITARFVQDNQARSGRGVLRGLHFQTGAYAQAKLVRVIEGEVFDVAVDMRPDSPTFRQWYGVTLSAADHRQLFVPRGFAHGYLVLSDWATFVYKCDNFYSKKHEGGIAYNDPALGIEWPDPGVPLILSERDQEWRFL